jgi:hypothetical protein
VGAFLDECDGFPSEGIHDDQVDAVSGAYAIVAGKRKVQEGHVKPRERGIRQHEDTTITGQRAQPPHQRLNG